MKRRFALITALFMLAFSLPVFSAEYKDMPPKDDKYYNAFEYAINKKLVSGDGTSLNPNSNITYAEALTIISRIKPFDAVEADITLLGVAKDKWYYSTVAKAYTLGYIKPDSTGMLKPEALVTKADAFSMIAKLYQKTSPSSNDTATCTRADFVLEIYNIASSLAGEESTSPTQGATEYSDLKAKAAQEAMQVALGILPDGTNYTKVASYKDVSQTDWGEGGGSYTGGSSSRPSTRPTEPPAEDDEETQPTEEPGTTPTEPPTEYPSENPTEEPTEPPTQEPTYGEYDGPIDNDKDNVVDDPFDDGWRPPGWVGDDDDNNDDGNSSGGGWDAEDEDFDINDADEPDNRDPTETPTDKPTEDPTDAPTQTPSESDTDAPTETDTDAPTEPDTDAPTEPDTDAPTEPDTNAPTEPDTDAPTEPDTDAPTEPDTDAPTEPDTDAPTEPDTDAPTEPDTDAPTEPDTDAPTEDATLPSEPKDEESDSESEDGEPSDGEADKADSETTVALLSAKEQWFD